MPDDQQLSDVLADFARMLGGEFPVQDLLDHLVTSTVGILPVTGAGVTLISSPRTSPHYVAASNDQALLFEQLQTGAGNGPCVEAYKTGVAVAAPDLRSDERFDRFTRPAVDAGLAAVFAFPLHHGDRRFGALDIYKDAPGPLSPLSMATAQTLADVAAAYLINAHIRSDLQDSLTRTREATLHDALTGLPNRLLLLERLEHAFARAQRSNHLLAVLFVDLDHFKQVNDTYGHRAGDELLVAVTERLLAIIRPGDTLARLSGDEFTILCEDLSGPLQVEGIVTRINNALALPFVLPSGPHVGLTASVGLAFTGKEIDTPSHLLDEADLAMYRAKRQRQRHGAVVDLRSSYLAADQAGLATDLPVALARDELSLAYQPIIDTVDGRTVGAEALLRWQHPTRGVVMPHVLLPLAEHLGLLTEVGTWVLEQAWADLQAWNIDRAEPPAGPLGIAVNFSASQILAASFPDTVGAILGAGHAAPQSLTVEVTESVFLSDPQRAVNVLNDLRDLGVILALDNLGTGYSSLDNLKRFPFDVVKIGSAFIADVEERDATSAIVGAVVQLAHRLNMTVVATGIETAAQRHEVTRLGCDLAQGHHFARAMPADTLLTYLQRT